MPNVPQQESSRVLIASANASLRNDLMKVVSQVHGLTVVGFIRMQEQVLTRTLVSAPALLLLDAQLCMEKSQIQSLRSKLPHLHVIVYGNHEDAGAAPVQARGEDAAAKPIFFVPAGTQGSFDDLRTTLNQLFAPRALRDVRRSEEAGVVLKTPAPAVAAASSLKRKPQVLVVASSTGGPFALTALFRMLPSDFPLPIAVVQHMPPGFTTMLAERLDHACPLEVLEAQPGMEMVPGRILIGPGDYHLTLQGKPGSCHAALNQQEREHSCRPAANVLFRSAAAIYGGSVLTVVLTGMGRDGFEGAQQLHQLGARVIVQDAATSTVWGMPGAIAQAGFADAILPLQDIADELTRSL